MPARILVVDDEPDLEPLILQKFRKRIRKGELDFQFARNGEEALVKLDADHSIDIVLSDINMPVMDGLTLLLRLGALERLLKTVVVSAYDDMQNLRTAMNRGAFDFLTKPIDFQDFENTLQKTMDELSQLRQATQHREQLFALQNELSIASKIQQSILPRPLPEDPRFEISAKMIPARVVGGDFYDFFFLDEHRLAFAVGDVSGKGVPAALYMAVSRTLLRATALQKLSPTDCLLYVNHALVRQSEGDMFVTLLYGVLHLESGELDYCVAGHTPPWLMRQSGPIQPLKDVRGTMLGIFDEPVIGCATVRLEHGDTLVLTTDGVGDAENRAGEEYSEDRLGALLTENAGSSPQTIVEILVSRVASFSEGAQQFDDITALAVRLL